MDLRTKVGQRLVVGFLGKTIPDSLRELVAKYKIGNVILFRENTDTEEQTRRLCSELQELILAETGIPAFITVDQEGGMVSRIPAGTVNVPGNMAIAATGEPKNAKVAAQITARQLRAMGMNFDLAPVLDVNGNAQNPVISVRSWGDDADQVCRYATEAVQGYNEAGLLSCGKHFPGHGDTNVDSHLGLPVINKSLDELRQMELKPFAAAIRAGIPAIMSSHILFPKIEPDNVPATMSRRIMTGLLRQEMGFEGLILSDCMRMKAISDHYGTAAGTVAAAKAGVDLIFVCHDLPYQIETAEAFYQAAVNGEVDAAEMDRSIERILAFKEKYAFVQSEPGLAGMQQDFDTVQELANRAVCLVQGPVLKPDGHTFFCGCADYRTSMVGNICAEKTAMVIRLQQEFGGSYMVTGKDPDEEEINRAVEAAADCSQIIVTTLKGHAFRGQLKLVQALAATGKPIMHIAQREPYDLSGEADSIRKLACFDSTDAAENAVVRVLRGAECKGILPIRL